MPAERLHKVLAARGVASRRAAERLITAGRVKVNGSLVTELGVSVDPSRDAIEVDGKRVDRDAEAMAYFVLHKPSGVLSTAKDDRGRKIVLDLVPEAKKLRLVPAGRLDYHSEGLVLLTNDGELINGLTHPAQEVPRTYHAKVKGRPDEKALDRLRFGIRLEDGLTQPAIVEELGLARVNTWIAITITEGRNRQVRRMCAAIGHPVQRLVRVAVGDLDLGDLPQGQSRALSKAEVEGLHKLAHTKGRRPRRKSRKRQRQVAPKSRPQ